jgi:hypothetical protein
VRFYLLQLGHQICFCVHSAGRVALEKLSALFGRGLIRLVAKSSRVGVVLPSNHFDPSLLPKQQAARSLRTKSVRRRQQYGMSVFLKVNEPASL